MFRNARRYNPLTKKNRTHFEVVRIYAHDDKSNISLTQVFPKRVLDLDIFSYGISIPYLEIVRLARRSDIGVDIFSKNPRYSFLIWRNDGIGTPITRRRQRVFFEGCRDQISHIGAIGSRFPRQWKWGSDQRT